MLVKYKNKANLWLIIGFIVEIVGNVIKGLNPSMIMFGWLIFWLGAGLFIFGCVNYVKAKGYNGAFGFLGLASLLGLIILALMPDKNKTAK